MKSYLKLVFALLVVFSSVLSSSANTTFSSNKSAEILSGVFLSKKTDLSNCTVFCNTFLTGVHPGLFFYSCLNKFECHQDPMSNCSALVWFLPSCRYNSNIVSPVKVSKIGEKHIFSGRADISFKVVDYKGIIEGKEFWSGRVNGLNNTAGPNNEFKILKPGIATLNYFRIFNRWGNTVFDRTGIDKGLDGTFDMAVISTGILFQKHGNTTLKK